MKWIVLAAVAFLAAGAAAIDVCNVSLPVAFTPQPNGFPLSAHSPLQSFNSLFPGRNTCGPTSLHMVMRYHGVDKSPMEICALIGTFVPLFPLSLPDDVIDNLNSDARRELTRTS